MKQQISERNKTIIQVNMAGIIMNLLLAVAKFVVGKMIHSRSVVLDAVNGFSDMITSVLSIVSVHYVGKRTNANHPFGYGRLEYICSMFGSAFVIFMALHASYDTILELIRAEACDPDFNTAVIVLMTVSMAAKIIYGMTCRRVGKRLRATALIMTGTESMGDSLVSAAILLNILLFRVTNIDLEPWLTLVMSAFIIKTGVEMFHECANKLLGVKGDPALYRELKRIIVQEDGVRNAFDLTIHNYGEEKSIGSVIIEVDEKMTAAETTKLVRRIRRKAMETGVRLTSIGVYGTSIADPEDARLWDSILAIMKDLPQIQRGYAFSYDPEAKTASFLVLTDLSVADEEKAVGDLKARLREEYPEITFEIDPVLEP